MHRVRLFVLTASIALVGLAPATAQSSASVSADPEAALRAADDGFWRAYNACDANAMAGLLAEDVEFFHDRTGLSRGREKVVGDTMTNLCSNPAMRIRRALVPESVRFDAIPGYGGVLTGEHLFFMTERGMPERQTGRARFVAVWRYDQGQWQMTRVLSLSHAPVAYVAPTAMTTLSDAQLRRYVGSYRMAGAGPVTLAIEAGRLVLITDKQRLTLVARSVDHFFATERPLMVDFIGGKRGALTGLTVTENGAVVDRGERVVGPASPASPQPATP